eukprot:TRINITY_DN65351_c0_g1_i1.p1 TRINITY_DN65351_c0_g1~~TRINITY_DN65351_c0_g1_i1.p1  ORF type:complete len:412 (+),score=35.55 TRINITY_DN65351_c0_g1_i1:122-1357(+)
MMSLGLDMSGGMQLATEYRDADTLGATPPRSQVEVTEVSEQAPRSETSTAIDVDDDRWLLFRFHEPYLEILGDVIEFGSKIYWSLGHDANPETTSCSTDTAEGQGGRLEETESDQARRCRTTCLNTMSFWTQAGSCVFLLQQHSTATLPAGISLVKSSAVFSTAVLHLKLASFAAPQVFVGVFFLSAACRAWRFHAAATLEDDCQTQRSFAAVCAALGVAHLALASTLYLEPWWLPAASSFTQAVVAQALSHTVALPALIHCAGRLAGKRKTHFMEAGMVSGTASAACLLLGVVRHSSVLLAASGISALTMGTCTYALAITDAKDCSNTNSKVLSQVGKTLTVGTLSQLLICVCAGTDYIGDGSATCLIAAAEYVTVNTATFEALRSRFAVNAGAANLHGWTTRISVHRRP